MGNYQTRQIITSRQQSQSIRSRLTNTSSIYLSSNNNIINQYYMLDNLNSVKLTLQHHQIQFIWLQPRANYNQHQQHVQRFRANLIKFDHFTTFQQLKLKLNNQNGNTTFRVILSSALEEQAYQFINRSKCVDKIYVFAQNIERIQNIMNRYSKAKYYGLTFRQLLNSTNVESNYQNSILFFVDEDIPLIRKYCLNYYSYVHHTDIIQSGQDFNQLTMHLFPNREEQINHFHQSYMQLNGQQQNRRNLILSEVFQNSFYWNLISKLPKVTSNPKRLGYLRFAFKDMFHMIRQKYLNQNKMIKTIYIVAQLNDEEISYLGQNLDNFMMFSTFVKGFVNAQNANNSYKKMKIQKKNPFFFEVAIPRKLALQPELDFGYMIMDKNFQQTESTPSVIFNIFNVFKVEGIDKQRCNLIYGALAEVYKSQQLVNSRRFLSARDNKLLSEFDIFQSNAAKIKNPISVYMQSKCYVDSIISCQTALTEIRQGNLPRQQQDLVLLDKGDSQRLNGNLNDAIQTYRLIQNEELRTLAMIRAAQTQLKRDSLQEAQQYFEFVLPRINCLLNPWGLYEDYYRARYVHSLLKVKRNQFQQAYAMLNSLKEDIFETYDHKIGAIDFMEDIINNIVICCIQMNAN